MTHSDQPTTLTIAGRTFVADPSGRCGVRRAACSSYPICTSRRARPLPGAGCRCRPMTRPKPFKTLAEVAQRFQPRTIVSLGDSFHDRAGRRGCRPPMSRPSSACRWGATGSGSPGTHDPRFEQALPGQFISELVDGAIRFVHEPTAGPVSGEVAGHLHPSAVIAVRGGRVRRKVFVSCETRLIMPAFGSLTGGSGHPRSRDPLAVCGATLRARARQQADLSHRGLRPFRRSGRPRPSPAECCARSVPTAGR